MLLAVSRAVGETMIVTMAGRPAGQDHLQPARHGDHGDGADRHPCSPATRSFDSPKTLSAFGLGLTLFLITLALNIVALRIVQKYREQYD